MQIVFTEQNIDVLTEALTEYMFQLRCIGASQVPLSEAEFLQWEQSGLVSKGRVSNYHTAKALRAAINPRYSHQA